MNIDTCTYTFDHTPTLVDIQGKLAELRESGAPKSGVVALAPADYQALAREVFGDPLPDFYIINVYSDDPANQIRAVAMPGMEPHSLVFGFVAWLSAETSISVHAMGMD